MKTIWMTSLILGAALAMPSLATGQSGPGPDCTQSGPCVTGGQGPGGPGGVGHGQRQGRGHGAQQGGQGSGNPNCNGTGTRQRIRAGGGGGRGRGPGGGQRAGNRTGAKLGRS